MREPMGNTIKLDLIRIDGGTQPRAAIVESLVADYAENVASLPPLSVFHDGKDYWLADGFHRYHAHRRAGSKTVPVSLHKGTQRDAILYSLGANATHGLRRTNQDKRHAVETALMDSEWTKWSNLKIAEICAVSESLVRTMRDAIFVLNEDAKAAILGNSQDTAPSTRTVKRGNTTYQQNVTNIGNARKSAPPGDIPPEYADCAMPDANEMAAIAERERIEREAFDKMLASDDALAAANAEIKRLAAQLAIVSGQRDQYMNRCNELVRQVRAMKRAAA